MENQIGPINTSPAPQLETTKSFNRGYIISAAIILVVAVAGYFVYKNIYTTPEAELARIVLAMQNTKTINTAGTVTVDDSEDVSQLSQLATVKPFVPANLTGTQPEKFTAQVTFASDYEARKAKLNAQFQMALAGKTLKPFTGSLSIVGDSSDTYMKFSQTGILDDMGSAELRDRWVTLGTNTLAGSGKQPAKNSSSPFAFLFGNLTTMIDLLNSKSQLDSFASYKLLPTTVVNSIACNDLQISISSAQLRTLLDKHAAQGTADPQSVSQLNKFADSFKQITLEIWANKQTSKMVKMAFSLSLVDFNGGDLNINYISNSIVLDSPVNFTDVTDAVTPDEALNISQESDLANNDGYKLFNQGQYDQAKPYFEHAITLNPANYRAYNNLGLVYLMQKDYNNAIPNFQDALRINPAHENPAYNLMSALESKLDCETLLATANNYVTDQDSPDLQRKAHWFKGDAYSCLNNYSQAITELKTTLQLNPTDPNNYGIYHDLGTDYLNSGQAAQAVPYFQQSIDWAKAHPELNLPKDRWGSLYLDLGTGYFRLSQPQQAAQAMRTAFTYDSSIKTNPLYQAEFKSLGLVK